MIRTPELALPEDAFTHAYETRVIFADTDALGIVYYASYLRWFERGRVELMRAAGLTYQDLAEGGLVLPVVETWCRYRLPARYDDPLTVRSWVHEMRHSSVLIGCRILRDDEVVAEGGTRLGCMTREGRPQRLPAVLKQMQADRRP